MGRWGDRESTDRSPHPSTSPSPQSAAILIAEDRETNIRRFSEYLAAKGYQLMFARNGKEAIERTTEERPDLILMDIQMPEMNGLEAIRHIRTDEELKTIPIIAVTTLVIPGNREQCLTAGADDYICKPVDLRDLAKTIEELLRKKGQSTWSATTS